MATGKRAEASVEVDLPADPPRLAGNAARHLLELILSQIDEAPVEEPARIRTDDGPSALAS